MRKFLRGASWFFLGVVTMLICAEVILRLLPVAEGTGVETTTAADPLFRFAPNKAFEWSRAWNFELRNRARTNNFGYVNDQDYSADGPRPLIAVIGNSYVEAEMIPYAETLQGLLAGSIGSAGRAYSFAYNGAHIADYLGLAKIAADRFQPDAMIFVINRGDVAQSIGTPPAGMARFVPVNGTLQLQEKPYADPDTRRLLRQSAVIRYLVRNLEVAAILERLKARLETPVRSPASDLPDDRHKAIMATTQLFFEDLPAYSGLHPEQILFVVEGARYPESAGVQNEQDRDGYEHTTFIRQGRMLGYEMIDLQPWFFAADRPNQKVDFPADGHWNALGHFIVGDAVEHSALWRRLFPAQHAGASAKRP